MSLLPKKKPAVVIAPPSANDTFGTTDRGRDGGKLDKRSLRATGRTEQFNTRITRQTLETFNKIAAQHGLKQNELLTDMTNAWRDREGVPDEEKEAGRTRALTIYGNADLLAGLEAIAKYHKASIHAIVEDLVAERLEKLQGSGDIPKMRAGGKR